MQSPDDIHRDLPADLERSESEQLVALALRLQAQRPAPAPTFRGDLRRRLLGGQDRAGGVMPPRVVCSLAVTYAASGLLLLAIAAAGLVDAGPFASS